MTRSVLTALQLVAGGLIVSRLMHGARRQSSLVALDSEVTAEVSVIIPARNEAGRIGACLSGLDGEPIAELLVIDDHSSDSTAEIARSHGAGVVSAEPLPDGWVGKPWALESGLRAATSTWLLFLDADTRPRPGIVGAAVAEAERQGVDLLSLGTRVIAPSGLQQALHASLLAGLVYRFGPMDAAKSAPPSRTMMNGQCVLVRRKWLIEHGGFTNVADKMTDDIALVQHLKRNGARVAFVDGSALIEVAMYGSSAETWREWGRSLPMADVVPHRQQLLDVLTLVLTQAVPVLRLLTGRTTVVDRILLAMRIALQAPLRQTFVQPRSTTWLAFLLDPLAVARLAIGTVKPSRSWRGRTYGPSRTSNR